MATGFVADGRRVMGLIWRNRIGLFAGVIAAQGAQPVIDALTDAGLDSVMSGSAGEALGHLSGGLGVYCLGMYGG